MPTLKPGASKTAQQKRLKSELFTFEDGSLRSGSKKGRR
jgi:hypothetical protein